jgi:hypothetical protein
VTSLKPYDMSKRRVLEAYWRVKANRGAAGIEALTERVWRCSRRTLQGITTSYGIG